MVPWYFVRIGWFVGVKYNGSNYGGKVPIWVALSLIILIVGTVLLVTRSSLEWVDIEFMISFLFLSMVILSLLFKIILILKSSRIN